MWQLLESRCMAAIAALRTALGALRRNPVLFLGGFVYGVVVLPQTALQLAGVAFAPTALQILTFFVTPFVLAGVIGMADESLAADTSLGTLRAVGSDKYVPFLAGTFVELAINLAFGIVLAVVGVAFVLTVGVGAVAGGGGGVSTGALALGGGAVLLVVLLAIAVRFLIQFFPVFIVVADSGVVGAFTDSYRFVRGHLVATLGYTLIQIVVGVVVSAPLVGFTLYGALQNFDPANPPTGAPAGAGAPGGFGGVGTATPLLSTPEIVVFALVAMAVTALGLAFQQTYAVAFYRRHAGGGAATGSDATPGRTGGEYGDGDADLDADADDDGGVTRTDDDAEWRYE